MGILSKIWNERFELTRFDNTFFAFRIKLLVLEMFESLFFLFHTLQIKFMLTNILYIQANPKQFTHISTLAMYTILKRKKLMGKNVKVFVSRLK